MKRFLALLLALSLIFAMAACGTETVIIDNTGSSKTEDTEENSSLLTEDETDTDGEEPASSEKEESSSKKSESSSSKKEEPSSSKKAETNSGKKPSSSSKKDTATSSKKPSSAKPQTSTDSKVSSSSKPTETDKKEEHVHSYKTTTTPPTCTEKGKTVYTCACGDTYTEEIAPSHVYVGYFCSKCDTINPDKVYDYLSEIIDTNGNDGAAMSVEYLMESGTYLIRDYNNNYLVKKSGFEGSDRYEYEINLSKQTFKVIYGTTTVNGKLDFASFAKTSKVNLSASKADFVDTASEAIHSLLSSVVSDFAKADIKLTLKDLGFGAY